MDSFIRTGKLTPHEVGLTDLLDMARITGDLPEFRALIAIQPESIDWGLDLTATVSAALPDAVRQARAVLDLWAQAEGAEA